MELRLIDVLVAKYKQNASNNKSTSFTYRICNFLLRIEQITTKLTGMLTVSLRKKLGKINYDDNSTVKEHHSIKEYVSCV